MVFHQYELFHASSKHSCLRICSYTLNSWMVFYQYEFSHVSSNAVMGLICFHTLSSWIILLQWSQWSQLPLLFGQLEKQSGRGIARVSGEKGKKLSVFWWRCKLLSHCDAIWILLKIRKFLFKLIYLGWWYDFQNGIIRMEVEKENWLRLQCEVKTNDHWVSFLGYHSNLHSYYSILKIML